MMRLRVAMERKGQLQTLSRNARAASRPGATADIVRDVLRLLEDRLEEGGQGAVDA